jgi:hypothetical protein
VTRLILVLCLALASCGRTVTAPEVACSTRTTATNYPLRNAQGDSVGFFTVIHPATCR